MKVPSDTDRLSFKPFKPEDLPLLTAMHSDPEVIKYVGWAEPPSEEENRAWLDRTLRSYKEEGIGHMAVHLKQTGEFIGRCGLRVVEIQTKSAENIPRWFWYRGSAPEGMEVTRSLEIGYTFSSPFWGKGYATESVNQFCSFAFANALNDTIVAVTFPENRASARVLEKAGFRQTGFSSAFGRKLVVHTLNGRERSPGE